MVHGLRGVVLAVAAGCNVSVSAMRLESVAPNHIPEMAGQEISLHGFFPAETFASFAHPGRSRVVTEFQVWLGDVELDGVEYRPPGVIAVVVPRSVAPGVYDLRVRAPSGRQQTLAKALTVTAARCGDGVLNGGELCDAGNLNNRGEGSCADPCNRFVACGDGVKEGDEVCDDGYRDPCGTCNADCTGAGAGSSCGDGVQCAELEACDDGYTDACGSCNADCSGVGEVAVCGDGELCHEHEVCDDGYADDCGSCAADCQGPGTGGTCGDGQFCPELEACEGDELGTATCRDFGWALPFGLSCDNDCALVVDGCSGPCQSGHDPDWDGLCSHIDPDDDDDGCPDEVDTRISAHGHLRILFAGKDEDPATKSWDRQVSDEAILATLLAMEHEVFWFSCGPLSDNQQSWDAALDADVDGQPDYDLLLVSESCASGDTHDGSDAYFDPWQIGILVTEANLWDEMDVTQAHTTQCLLAGEIIAADHFITAPRQTGPFDLFTSAPTQQTPGGGCVALATGTGAELATGVVALVVDANDAGRLSLFTIEAGAPLLTGVAAGRRIGFGPARPEAHTIGWTGTTSSLFLRSLAWAAGQELLNDADGDGVGDDCDQD